MNKNSHGAANGSERSRMTGARRSEQPAAGGDSASVDEIDFSPFLDYLKTENGHALAGRVIGLVEDFKKATLEKTTRHATLEKILQITIIVVVVGAASWLSYLDKFETSIGVLFGTLVGYFFGKR